MIKQLLSAAALAAMALSVNAAEVTLWEGEQTLNWSTGTFAIPATDLSVLGNESAVLTLHYTLDTTCEYWQFKPVADTDGWPALEVATELGNEYQSISVQAGTTSYDLVLGATDIATIKAGGLRFQGYGMTMTKVTTDTDKVIDPNVLWEGEYEISDWKEGAAVPKGKVKAGDILTYTFTTAGADGGQVLVKNDSWGDLLGTTKINVADLAKGELIIGVTQEMLDNCGSKFFLSGNAGAIVTKVAKTGTFDPKDVCVYGTRVPGVEIFSVIPEGKTKIAVEFDAEPEWAALCKGWDAQDFLSEKSADGKTITYTITPDYITAVAADKKFVVNATGGANLVKVYYPSEVGSGIAGIAAEKKIVNVYDLAGRVVRHNVDSANAVNGLAKGIYIVNGKKVLVK